MFSLRTIIDDILLIVRNNNISESEDLSRTQIAAWVMAYKALLQKKEQDKDKETGDDSDNNDSLQTTVGPLKMIDVSNETGDMCIQRKRTAEKIPEISGDSGSDIVSVTDKYGCVIQFMNDKRRHFHYFRRYTFGEPVCWYEDGYLYVEGIDINDADKITVSGNFTDPEEGDEDETKIPGWMIPDIKSLIMKNELAFMLNRPSDDSNNSTLASVKPHGPQDQEE